MTRTSRLLLFVASILLLLSYVLPLWRISLDAPQYPEGLGLYIWLDTITGEKPHDLKNINGLNHYIGMQPIKPEDFPELQFLPYAVGLLMIFGLLAAVTRKRALLKVWLLCFIAFGVIGIADFYKWGYDFGHNLDFAHAAIKVPGMAYQPPLIGSKKLLNFTATSLPASGGWILILSFLIGVAAFASGWKTTSSAQGKQTARSHIAIAAGLLFMTPLLWRCNPAPEPIHFGSDLCTHCMMSIVDPKFASELITQKGKVYKYDSIECLAAGYFTMSKAATQLHATLVPALDAENQFIEAREAFFFRGDNVKSPMRLNLAAFTSSSAAGLYDKNADGEVLRWNQVIDYVVKQWKLDEKTKTGVKAPIEP